jgi:hypothetical protein
LNHLLRFLFASSDMSVYRGIEITDISAVNRNKAWIYDSRNDVFIKNSQFFKN